MTDIPLGDLQLAATHSLSAAYHAPDRSTERTQRLAQAAEALVRAREHFITASGKPDWTGRTGAYRSWVREVYNAAAIPSGDQPSLMAAVRYHVSAIVRQTLGVEELEDLGLRTKSSRERRADERKASALRTSWFSGGPRIDDPQEAEAVVESVKTALTRVGDITPGSLTHEQAEKMTREVEEIIAEADRILSAFKDAQADGAP